MHFYSSKNSFLSDYLISVFFFSYNNSVIKKYYDRIYNCINHLVSHAVFFELFISSLISSYLIYRFYKIAWHFMNLSQCIIMCFTVFLIWSHEQTDDKKLRTWALFRKIMNSLWFIWICMIIKLSIFCSCAWNLIILWLKNLIFSKFHFKNLLIQQCFHLCISACFADISAFSFNLN